jgi:mannose/fructose/N-acetylgalactosamine-specific phosphotransferase system component IIC
MFKKAEKGGRKMAVDSNTKYFLLAGFILALYMKADSQLFIAYGVFVSGTGFAFMWGNSQEHKSDAVKNPQKPA